MGWWPLSLGMATLAKAPGTAPLTGHAAVRLRATQPACNADAWHLLAPGDEVSIAGEGAYELVHVDQAKAWLTSLGDGSHYLVSAASLRLCQAGPAAVPLS